MMPASLSMATLFPCFAMTPSLLADPLRDVPMVLKVSEVESMTPWSRALSYMSMVTERRAETLDWSAARESLFCLSGAG